MKVEPGNILKLFLNFGNFEPQYSYRLYSYKKKECIIIYLDKRSRTDRGAIAPLNWAEVLFSWATFMIEQ